MMMSVSMLHFDFFTSRVNQCLHLSTDFLDMSINFWSVLFTLHPSNFTGVGNCKQCAISIHYCCATCWNFLLLSVSLSVCLFKIPPKVINESQWNVVRMQMLEAQNFTVVFKVIICLISNIFGLFVWKNCVKERQVLLHHCLCEVYLLRLCLRKFLIISIDCHHVCTLPGYLMPRYDVTFYNFMQGC